MIGRSPMDLLRLRYVIAAADTGSFRKAASKHNVQQSTISRAIRQLEDQLGVSIFERSRTGACLTDAGRRLLEEARTAVELLDLAALSAGEAGRAETGIVRVGIISSLAAGFLRELLSSYFSKHPNIDVDIQNGRRDEHITAVQRRWVDVAILAGVSDVEGCDTVVLWEERIHVALPSDHRLADRKQVDWPDLFEETFIVSRMGPGPDVTDFILRRSASLGVMPNVVYRAVVQETLLHLVALGQGITLVSSAWMAVQLPEIVLRPLSGSASIVQFSAVWSTQNDNPALRCFISVAHVLAGHVRRGSSDWVRHSV
ncbi:LysR substrate-binding domain-containing protein [Pelagerythrobacter marensis]|uniref:LysR substrate-binding domain-containing protein n=1 Tax=Pelagerythrobacter marensis TaxID=543877 RepID=A0ABZ2DA28_9SPHN